MIRAWLIAAAAGGFLSVAAGAAAAHIAPGPRAAELLRSGALYGMVHAAALIAVAAIALSRERLGLAFRAATGRHPTAAEASILERGFERVLGQYRADQAAARKLLSTGERPRDPTLDAAEVAAYTGMLNTILNLDEVITKE